MTDVTSRRLLMGMGSSAILAGVAAAGPAAAQSAAAAPLRILLLNPNSSPDFTKIIAAEARRVGRPATEFVEVTAPFGPRYIGTRTTIAIAGHAAVDALAQTLAIGPEFRCRDPGRASARRACPRCRRWRRSRWSTC